MDVGRTEGIGGAGRIEDPRKISRTSPTQGASSPPPADKVEISEGARLISEALTLPQVRADRIEEVKRLIDSGKFETDERLQGAIERFIQENRDLLE